MNKKFIHEYQLKNFTPVLERHYIEQGCEFELTDDSVIVWYIEKLQQVA